MMCRRIWCRCRQKSLPGGGGSGQSKKTPTSLLYCHNENLHAGGPVTVTCNYACEPQRMHLPSSSMQLSKCSARGTVDVKSAALATALRLQLLCSANSKTLSNAIRGMLAAIQTLLKRCRMDSTVNVRTATCAKRNDRSNVIRWTRQFALRCRVYALNPPDEVILVGLIDELCAESGIDLAKSTLVK